MIEVTYVYNCVIEGKNRQWVFTVVQQFVPIVGHRLVKPLGNAYTITKVEYLHVPFSLRVGPVLAFVEFNAGGIYTQKDQLTAEGWIERDLDYRTVA